MKINNIENNILNKTKEEKWGIIYVNVQKVNIKLI